MVSFTEHLGDIIVSIPLSDFLGIHRMAGKLDLTTCFGVMPLEAIANMLFARPSIEIGEMSLMRYWSSMTIEVATAQQSHRSK
jgi:hypothetical protein